MIVLNNHIDFFIKYHKLKNAPEEEGGRIVAFLATPRSIKHEAPLGEVAG